MSRIEELCNTIRHHRILYYAGHPQVEDRVFDAFVDELKALDPENPVLTEVGAPPPNDTPWLTVEHHISMGSLDKVNSEEEIREWIARWDAEPDVGGELCLQEKLDGLSMSLDYMDGKLVRAVTRGSGRLGEDVTRNVLQMSDVPHDIPEKLAVTVRGEILVTNSDLTALNKVSDHPYKNARNAAAGLTRRLSGKHLSFLRLRTYDLLYETHPGGRYTEFKSYRRDIHDKLVSWGFVTPNTFFGDAQHVVDTFRGYEAGVRATLDYDIDGMVVKLTDLRAAQRHNLPGKNPKTQVAWKFESATAVTKLLDIVWQVGQSRKITPVAILRPVPLCGVEIERASLASAALMESLHLWKGCNVLISRRNDVIPYIECNVDYHDEDDEGKEG